MKDFTKFEVEKIAASLTPQKAKNPFEAKGISDAMDFVDTQAPKMEMPKIELPKPEDTMEKFNKDMGQNTYKPPKLK